MCRLRLNYYANKNKAGKLLANRLKARRTKTKIPSIIHLHTKNTLTNLQDIADAFADYYSSLYNLSESPDIPQPTDLTFTDFLSKLQLPSRSSAQLASLNAPFTMAEIDSVIRALPNGKSPGPDGLPTEYYKTFKHTLSPHLLSLFQEAASSGSFPKEMLMAHVVTKPGKPLHSPSNFHPISLLNVDVKVYAKLLASRIQAVLPSLIKCNQSGLIKGRQPSDATRRMINLIHHASASRTPSLLLSIHAEKAFDRVHWGYVRATLHKFYFQGLILSATLALYSFPSAKVLTNRLLSKFFNITNGTRKGCPLSPSIFNLAI